MRLDKFQRHVTTVVERPLSQPEGQVGSRPPERINLRAVSHEPLLD